MYPLHARWWFSPFTPPAVPDCCSILQSAGRHAVRLSWQCLAALQHTMNPATNSPRVLLASIRCCPRFDNILAPLPHNMAHNLIAMALPHRCSWSHALGIQERPLASAASHPESPPKTPPACPPLAGTSAAWHPQCRQKLRQPDPRCSILLALMCSCRVQLADRCKAMAEY